MYSYSIVRLMLDSLLVGTNFLDVSTICGPIHAASMVDQCTHSYSTYNIQHYYCSSTRSRNTASVLCIRDDTFVHTAVVRTPLMHVARTTSSVRSRYPSTIVSLLICSVSSWFSFGIPIRSSKQYTAGLIPLLCNRTHSGQPLAAVHICSYDRIPSTQVQGSSITTAVDACYDAWYPSLCGCTRYHSDREYNSSLILISEFKRDLYYR